MRKVAIIGLALGLAVAGAQLSASAAPADGAAEGGRSISGTIRGVDGRFVNAQISLVLRSANGTFLTMSGQPSPNPGAYAATISMNPSAPADGLGAGGDATWSFTGVPANAVLFTLEVYPRASGQGVTYENYGGAARRRVPLRAGGAANVRLRLPLHCGVPGGTTGSVRILRFHNGQPAGNLSRFIALAEKGGPSSIQGFRSQREFPPGESAPELDGLAPNQRYSVEISAGATRRSFFGVPVRRCQRTDLILWTGSRPFIPPRFSRLSVSLRGGHLLVPGDFDGDGDDDLYVYGPGALPDELWRSRGTGNGFDQSREPMGGNLRPVPGDFNRDGIDDIFFYGPGRAADRIWRFDDDAGHTTVRARAGGGPGTFPVSGDFNGNGHDDVLLVASNGRSTMRSYGPNGASSRRIGTPRGMAVRAGDFDGDGKADLLWHRSPGGAIELWYGRPNGGFVRRSHAVRAGAYRPIVADVDGDFRSDVIWYTPSGPDLLWRGRARTAPFFTEENGNVGMTRNATPAVGDWNGDGTQDPLLDARGGSHDTIWRSNQTAWLPQRPG